MGNPASISTAFKWVADILNSITEGVIIVDQEAKITFINRMAEELTGWEQSQAAGEPLSVVFQLKNGQTGAPLDSKSTTLSNAKALFLNQTILVRRDLHEFQVTVQITPLKTKNNRHCGAGIVFQDISEKQKIETELLKTQKMESLGILAGGIAHDFNNILAAILANLQLAKLKLGKNEEITRYLEETIEITHKASDLTKQLLTFSKGGAPVKKTTSIVTLVKESVQFILTGSRVKALYSFAEDLWEVDIDEGQISQVINNLTINAKQAMVKGGLLKISGRNVRLEGNGGYTPGRYVKLTFTDNGVGIPKEAIQKIFDPFFTTKKQGSGLGLSTSFSIIKKHNGYIEATSEPGMTVFSIYLPASTGQSAAKEAKKEIAGVREAKVLFMDDEEAIRKVVGEMLTYYGYQVVPAKDGQEAIEKYREAKENNTPFDAVIMDLTIPGGMGGQEAIAILRFLDPEVKAIVSSGYVNDPILTDYEKYGFSSVICKPYKFDKLNEILTEVIAKEQLRLGLELSG